MAVRGLPTVPVPETILGCARELGLPDVVVLVDAADAAVGRRHQPERIRAWEALLTDSAFSVPGRHRLLRRWRS